MIFTSNKKHKISKKNNNQDWREIIGLLSQVIWKLKMDSKTKKPKPY